MFGATGVTRLRKDCRCKRLWEKNGADMCWMPKVGQCHEERAMLATRLPGSPRLGIAHSGVLVFGSRHWTVVKSMQVYGFGGVSCVVDTVAGVVRAQLDGRWAPVSLEALLAAARLRGRSA